MQFLLGTAWAAGASRGPGLRAILVTTQPEGMTVQRVQALGALVDVEATVDTALFTLADDAMGYDLFIMDCDGFGGVDAGVEAVARLIAADARMRVMLVSAGFDEPVYPLGRRTAVCLPAGACADVFQRGLDHALRDRVAVTLM